MNDIIIYSSGVITVSEKTPKNNNSGNKYGKHNAVSVYKSVQLKYVK